LCINAVLSSIDVSCAGTAGCQHHSGHETNIAFPRSGVQRSTHPICAIGSTDAVVHRRVA